MRWGILVNLAVILTVSGILLLLVFTASMERAALDAALKEAEVLAGIVEGLIRNADSPTVIWDSMTALCRATPPVRIVAYDSAGLLLGGCGTRDASDKPDVSVAGRRIRVLGSSLPAGVFRARLVVFESVGDFAYGIRAVRGVVDVPSPISAPSWRFFGAYLLLTQSALFFLGYLLFHRTVIGPVSEAARLAGKAAGIADFVPPISPLRFRGDIQRITAGLRAMLLKIVKDQETLKELIEQLRASNRDLEAAQQGLIRSEKLAGVGRLAAGLAHELGNPLQIVMGYSELLGKQLKPEETAVMLTRMDQELRRIDDVLKRLLDFARPIRHNVVLCDFNELVKDCGEFLRGRKAFRSIDLEYVTDPELTPMDGEPEKIRQVLVNLIFNAADALPESGGKITLRTARTEDGVRIEVEDNGSGVSTDDLEKVFDPFFTTKEPGQGTGLGLAVCLGLVESMGGKITIGAADPRGTIVTVTIPKPDEVMSNRDA